MPPGTLAAAPLLTDAQREQLRALATVLEIRPRGIVYREGAPAGHIFIGSSGIVKIYRDLPSGKRRIVTFWTSGDIFGLAEKGKFVCTAQAVTPVTLHRIPMDALKQTFLEDGSLQFQFLIKVTQEYREIQRQKIALTRRDAIGKVATFLDMLERQAGDWDPCGQHCGTDDPVRYRELPRPLAGSRQPRNPRAHAPSSRRDSRSVYRSDPRSHPLRPARLEDLESALQQL